MRKILFLILPLVIISQTMSGCGNNDDNAGGFDLFDIVKQTGPVITPAELAPNGKNIHKTVTWLPGSNFYEIFSLFREYDDSRDDEAVDISNMYKAIHSITAIVSNGFSYCNKAVADEGGVYLGVSRSEGTVEAVAIIDQAITPPFDFEDDQFDDTYNCMSKVNNGKDVINVVAKDIENKKFILIGWKNEDDDGAIGRNVYQVFYNSETNDIEINGAFLVNYPSQTDIAVRLYMKGNADTGLFSLKILKYRYGEDKLDLSITGHGYSRGEGKYYLLKLTSLNPVTADAYFCLGSDMTQEVMEAMDEAGSKTVPAECADHAEGLAAFYTTDEEVPTTDDVFTGVGYYGIELDYGENSALSAPSNLRITTANPTQLHISWDEVDEAISYNLYWSDNPDLITNSTKIDNIKNASYSHSGLVSGLTYYYYVTAVNSAGESAASNKAKGTPFMIAVYGDTRALDNEKHQQIIDAIVSLRPNVVFNVGDLVLYPNNADDWVVFNSMIEDLLQTAEFYPAAGNHEEESALYYDNFELPNNEKWYAVDKYGIHFIVLNTNLDASAGSEQYQWLENDLDSIGNDIKFKISLFHHPPFSSAVNVWDVKGLITTIVPLLDEHSVDIVFNGHAHNYERSKYNDTYYIVTGGGGSKLHPSILQRNPYKEIYLPTYEFCVLYLSEGRLVVDVFNENLEILDTFQVGGL